MTQSEKIQELEDRINSLKGIIMRISSAAGLPDATEACRVILKFCKEAREI